MNEHKVDPVQKRMAELLSKEYGLDDNQAKKIELYSLDEQEGVAKKYAQDNLLELQRSNMEQRKDIQDLNKYRITDSY